MLALNDTDPILKRSASVSVPPIGSPPPIPSSSAFVADTRGRSPMSSRSWRFGERWGGGREENKFSPTRERERGGGRRFEVAPLKKGCGLKKKKGGQDRAGP